MNERIRELAAQAGFYHMGIGLIIGIEEYHQKFAQLIIQKCCEISDEVERADLPVVASKFVKAHFGVE
jgi:uncharacterized protein YaaQ